MSTPAEQEIRLRCVEAAAKHPDPRHSGGMTTSVLEMAAAWELWVRNGGKTEGLVDKARGTLGLPKKG